ncbi:hypothetical protein ACFLY6_02710 [Candidatus Dependentiae bacterium]
MGIFALAGIAGGGYLAYQHFANNRNDERWEKIENSDSHNKSNKKGKKPKKDPEDDSDMVKHYRRLNEDELKKAQKKEEFRVREHEKKHSDFKNDPDAYDNKGLLKNVSEEIRAKRIWGRLDKLKRTVMKHKRAGRVIRSVLDGVTSKNNR